MNPVEIKTKHYFDSSKHHVEIITRLSFGSKSVVADSSLDSLDDYEEHIEMYEDLICRRLAEELKKAANNGFVVTEREFFVDGLPVIFPYYSEVIGLE